LRGDRRNGFVAGTCGADLAADALRKDLRAGSSALAAVSPALARGRFEARRRAGSSPPRPAVGLADALPSSPADVPPVASCGDGVIAVFMAATAAAMPESEGLGGDADVVVGARLPRAVGVGVVAVFSSWGAAADALVVPRVASAGVPFRRVTFIAARVVRTAGAVALLDVAAVDDRAATRIALACAPLVDGAGFSLRGNGGLGGSGGLDATRTLRATGGSSDGGLGTDGSLAAGCGLAAGVGWAAGLWAMGGLGTAGGLAGGGGLAAGGRRRAGCGLGAPAAAAAASCLAAIDRTEGAAVPAGVLAVALSRRGVAVGRVGGGAGARAICAAPPSLEASGGCSSRRFSLGGSLSCGSSSCAGRSARGLPGSGELGVGETVDGVSGGGAWGCSRRGAPEARSKAEEGALASLDVGDRDAEGGRACTPMTAGTTGNTDNAVDAIGGGW